MFEYEHFLAESFPVCAKEFGTLEDSMSPLDKAARRAIRYMEMCCSAAFGYPGEAHLFTDKESKSIDQIPNTYDSGLLLPLIKDTGISSTTNDCLINVVRNNKQKTGLYNYFTHGKEANFFPDDIDDTSVNMMALYLSGAVDEAECRRVARTLINYAMRDDNGIISTWLLLPRELETKTIILEKYLKVPKTCAGCVTNFLWFLATFGMETDPSLLASVEYVDEFVDSLVNNRHTDNELPCMVYYTNKYINYFFLARYISASSDARNRIGNKFRGLVLDEMDELTRCQNPKALNIASVILAVLQMDLHIDSSSNASLAAGHVSGIISKLIGKLINMQHLDGSFDAWKVFRWNRLGHYGGSKAFTTGLALAAIRMFQKEFPESLREAQVSSSTS